MKDIRIVGLGILLLLFFLYQGHGHAQIEASLPSHRQQTDRQQIVQEFITLICKGDICALLNHCDVPPLSKTQRRPLFTVFPPSGQAEVRLQRDKLLRHYIDRLRELIIVFNRLTISKKSELLCCPVSADSPNHFTTRVEIKTPPSALAATLSPDLDEKNLSHDSLVLLSFTLTVHCSEEGWKIASLSTSSFFPMPPYYADP